MVSKLRSYVSRHPWRVAFGFLFGGRLIGGGIVAIAEGWRYWDGLWYGVVTQTSTGYGDFFPKTSVGRFAAEWILMWPAIVGLLILTGAIAAEIIDAKADHEHEDTEILSDDVDHAIVQATEVLECLQELRKQATKHDERYILAANGNGAPSGASSTTGG